MLTNNELLPLLRQACQDAGSMEKFAKTVPVSKQYVQKMLARETPISKLVSDRLGYVRVVGFEPVRKR